MKPSAKSAPIAGVDVAPGRATDLRRYIEAQTAVFDQVERELRAGRKRTHWMWFVFPQLRGLGHSAMADRYGLADLAEARAYLADPLLGPRLAACAGIVNALERRDAQAVFGHPDTLKFRSCMTLFARAAECDAQAAPFARALDRYFDGAPDPRTLALLDAG